MKPAGHFCLKTVLYNLIDRSNQALYARLLFCAQFLKKMRAASKQLSTAVGQAVERADGEAYLVDDEFYISVGRVAYCRVYRIYSKNFAAHLMSMCSAKIKLYGFWDN